MLCSLGLVLVANVAAERGAPAPAVPASPATGFPLRFEPVGQAGSVAFSADALGARIALDDGGLALLGTTAAGGWRLNFARATGEALVERLETSLGPTNTLVGPDATGWLRDVNAYRTLSAPLLSPTLAVSASGTVDRVTLHLDIDRKSTRLNSSHRL